jgi:hypothetical protein
MFRYLALKMSDLIMEVILFNNRNNGPLWSSFTMEDWMWDMSGSLESWGCGDEWMPVVWGSHLHKPASNLDDLFGQD